MRLNKYKILITFLDSPRGESAELQSMMFKTKPITLLRAKHIIKEEANSVWPHWKYTLVKL